MGFVSKLNITALFLSLAFFLCAYSCSGDDNGGTDAPKRTPGSDKVLFIGIDGCLAAAINSENMPNLHTLLQESWAATNALAEVPTWSATGWSGLMTGVSVAKHKVVGNDFAGNNLATYPSMFKYIKVQHPGWYTASIVQWGPINTYINKAEYFDKHLTCPGDQSVENGATAELSATDAPEAMFVHFDDVDHAGHDYRFDLGETHYAAAVATADARVGRLLAAVKARPSYSSENWLIAVVTDHGGVNTGHGGASYTEQRAFIILNNKNLSPQLIDTPPTYTPRAISADGDGNVEYRNGIYGTLPDLPALDFGADKSFTIEMKVKPSKMAAGFDPAFLCNKDWNSGGNPGIAMVTKDMGDLRINLAGGGTRVDLDYAHLFQDGNAHFVSLVFDRGAGKARLYVDGALHVEKDVSAMGSLSSAHPLRLGQDGTSQYGHSYEGMLTEVRIWSGAALDASTISAYSAVTLTSDGASHPNLADLAIYAPGNFSGTTLAGGRDKPSIPLTSGSDVDFNGAPYLYNLPATVFSFLGLAIDPAYGWDGRPLVNFSN